MDTATALWLLPARLLQWGGLILAAAAMLLLVDLIIEHWRTGRETDEEMQEDDL
jgi:hypothetical protein